jgi:hypothetical protein
MSQAGALPAVRVVAVAATLVLGAAVPARAQQAAAGASKWTVELYGGAAGGQTPGGVGITEFPTGAAFTTAGGDPSRRIPSWYFGDGARLFNQVQQQFATQFGVDFAPIVPLDATATGSAARRGTGVNAGARVTRRLSRRYSVEIGFEYGRTPLEIDPDARAAIEATRTSFEEGFTGLLSTAPIADLSVTSTVELEDGRGYQTAVTGTVVVDLTRHGRVSTHVVGGAGLLMNSGAASEVRLRGGYHFSLFGVIPYTENDSVTLRFIDRQRATIGLVGGGFTYDLGTRQALGVNIRAQIGASGVRTMLLTTAAAGRGTPAEVLPSDTTPSVQFSTIDGHSSSLTPGATELQTFSGSGLQTRVQITVGYLFKF